jgi:hypothetical protein
MATMRNLLGLCGLVMILTVLPVNGGPQLTLRVTPLQSFAPATMRVTVHIEPSAANRALTIVADGSEFYRSSQFPLEGDQSAKTFEVFFPSLPGGEYEVYAYLMDSLGQRRAIARQSARVIPVIN